MLKFGRTYFSVHRVGTEYANGVTLLIQRFVEYQALGGVIPEGESIQMKALPPGGICRHRGDLNNPDFNNVHVEIEWPVDALK
jgi:hypothetical protein